MVLTSFLRHFDSLIRPAYLEQLSLLLLEVTFSYFYFIFKLTARSGWITHYCSWRAMHGILGLLGLIAFTTIYFLFPETSQPGTRGIEKMKAKEHGLGSSSSSTSFVFINPLRSLWLLRSPIMVLIVSCLFYFILVRHETKSIDLQKKLGKSIIVFASMVSAFCEVFCH